MLAISLGPLAEARKPEVLRKELQRISFTAGVVYIIGTRVNKPTPSTVYKLQQLTGLHALKINK